MDDKYNPLKLEVAEMEFIENLTAAVAQSIITDDEKSILILTDQHQGSEQFLDRGPKGDESEVCPPKPSADLRRIH